MKDHEIAKLVNDLRDVAIKYHDMQQLRERIAGLVRSALTQAQAEPVHADLMRFYDVGTADALIQAQAAHIEKLQAKLPRLDFPPTTRVREG